VRRLKAISLYTGIGGLDYGFEAAGFRTAVGLEIDEMACSVLRANRKWPILQGDISTLSSRSILTTAGIRAGEADVLIGGPPCQPFSKAGNWNLDADRHMLDPRATTLSEYLRVLGDTRPNAFLLENVPGLAQRQANAGLKFILSGIAAVNKRCGTNYGVSTHIVNAADYGVPQSRERLFLVGFRDGRPFVTPRPTHCADQVSNSELAPHTTAWDAIGDLDTDMDGGLELSGKWCDLLPSIPEGQNYLWHTRKGGGARLFGWRTRYWNFLLKLAKNKPSWTIPAQPGPAIGPFHWRNRRLSIRELCRLQTIPDSLQVACSRTTAQKLIGNAVPSLLAEVFASAIRSELLHSPRTRHRLLTLAVSPRGSMPRATRVSVIPEKYLKLQGRHNDHPGAGLGRGAVRWRRNTKAASADRQNASLV
jgi:DNA (cytosine-5)-methyltransferase 1